MNEGRSYYDRLEAWIKATDAVAAASLPRLLTLSPAALAEELATQTEYRTVSVLSRILEIARANFETAPVNALELTTIVTEAMASIDAPEEFRAYVNEFRGDAWKEHANALRGRMRSKEALVATERARECYALIGGASDQKLAILDLVIGGTLHELGRSDEGMARIRSARKTLCAYGDARQIYAAIMESWILFDLQQFREAQVVLHAAAVDAEANEDWESMARIHDHLGKVAIELGDLIGALTSLQKAAYLFERQG